MNRPCGPDALGHELADCLWDVIVLAGLHYVDLAAEFHRMTDDLKRALTDPSGPRSAISAQSC